MRHGPELQEALLDRLVDREPEKGRPQGEPHSKAERNGGAVRQRLPHPARAEVGASMLRDLENLLNTRRSIPPLAEGDLAGASVIAYGAGDFSSQNPRSHEIRQRIRREIERLLQQFEPRLKNVSVRLDPAVEPDRTLRFRIDALLPAEPVAVPVAFDTRFDINSGTYSIFK